MRGLIEMDIRSSSVIFKGEGDVRITSPRRLTAYLSQMHPIGIPRYLLFVQKQSKDHIARSLGLTKPPRVWGQGL